MKTRTVAPAGDSLRPGRQGPGHLLVQFAKAPGPAEIESLQRLGARVVGSVPDGGLAISVAKPTSFRGTAVVWAGPLAAADKISPLLTANGSNSGPVAVVVEFHPDVPVLRVRQRLRTVHVQTLPSAHLAPNHSLVTATPAQMAALAGFDEVAYVFPASQDLIQGNRVMACTGAMMAAGPVGQYVAVGSGWGGAGSDGVVQLSYVFGAMSAQLPAANAQAEIARALQEWAKYAAVRFVPGSDADDGRTVAIEFAAGAHGDGYPFLPGSPVLAHTFFPAPPNAEPIAGDMHFNDGQTWHIGSDVDLYTVALHEAGHALGLGHTDNPQDVMYPYYRFGATLSSDDIAGVQALYGAQATQPPAPPAAAALRLTITSPASASTTTTAASIPLTGTAGGGTGTLQVVWANSQGGSGAAAGTAQWSVAAVPLALGTNSITVQVTDGGGHSLSSLVTVVRQAPPSPPSPPPAAPPTSGPPSLAITSPAMPVVATTQPSITLTGTASTSVASVTWTTSTGGAGTASGTTQWTASNIPLLVGVNTITVVAANGAGSTSWRSVTVVRN